MNVIMSASIAQQRDLVPIEPCSVTMVYDDEATRATARGFSIRMLRQFGAEFEMDFTWWKLSLLENPRVASEAAAAAAHADLLVFAVEPYGDFSEAVKLWCEDWLRQRGERDGALIALMPPNNPARLPSGRQLFLQNLTRRARLDSLPYALSAPPPAPRLPLTDLGLRGVPPFPPGHYRHEQARPLQWGINE